MKSTCSSPGTQHPRRRQTTRSNLTDGYAATQDGWGCLGFEGHEIFVVSPAAACSRIRRRMIAPSLCGNLDVDEPILVVQKNPRLHRHRRLPRHFSPLILNRWISYLYRKARPTSKIGQPMTKKEPTYSKNGTIQHLVLLRVEEEVVLEGPSLKCSAARLHILPIIVVQPWCVIYPGNCWSGKGSQD